MQLVRTLIVDDEAHARRRLRRMLETIPGVTVVGEAPDGTRAVTLFRETRPSVVFLDVVMPELDGLAAARAMHGAAIIYVTAHQEHAVQAFDVNAVDYLLKPVRRDRLVRAVERIREASRTSATAPAGTLVPLRPLVARTAGSTYLLDPRNIVRFRADAKYTIVTCDGCEYLLESSLNQLEALLEQASPGEYLRVHRSELVKVPAILALHQSEFGLELELHDGQRARVSRRMVAKLRARLGL